MTSWGFVGLGDIGAPMAATLARSGFTVTGLYRPKEGREAPAAPGVKLTSERSDLRACEVIGICVKDVAQVDDLLGGEDGLFSICRPDTLLVLHTTLLPDAATRLAREAADHGLRLMDAPMSGLPARAASGELTFYVGGEEADLARAMPGLEAMGRTIVRMGGVGAGETMKVLGNVLTLTTTALVGEVIRIGRGAGVAQDALEQGLQSGPADSFILRQFGNFQAQWTGPNRQDAGKSLADLLGLAAEVARRNGVAAPLLGVAMGILPQSLLDTLPS